MNKKNLRSADILTGIIFIIVGLLVAKFSIDLMMTNTDPRFYASAGFVPLVFAILFIIISISIIVNAVKEGGTLKLFSMTNTINALKSKEGINTIYILGIIALYIFVLMNFLPYFLSTFIFLVLFIQRFYQKSIVKIVIISLVAVVIVTYLFGTVAQIPLPGTR